MRAWIFARRNAKEILRDPLSFAFWLGFPIVLLLLLTAIQSSVPVALFELHHLTPGICIFGLSFLTLFSATIISKDRKSTFLLRLYATPMKPLDYIIGYTLPILPIAILQSVACYGVAAILGLKITVYTLCAVLGVAVVSVLYIAMGLLFGSILNEKQVGGVCGALLTNLSAWLSGIWFDIELIGGVFTKICNALPFLHAVELLRAVLNGNFAGIFPHLWWVLGYSIAVFGLAVWLFLRQMKRK